jgi:hypothetical protein
MGEVRHHLQHHLAYRTLAGSFISPFFPQCLTPFTAQVVLTPLGRKAWPEEKAKSFLEKIPTGSFAEPDQVGKALAFLASDIGGSINGSVRVHLFLLSRCVSYYYFLIVADYFTGWLYRADLRIDGGFTIV